MQFYRLLLFKQSFILRSIMPLGILLFCFLIAPRIVVRVLSLGIILGNSRVNCQNENSCVKTGLSYFLLFHVFQITVVCRAESDMIKYCKVSGLRYSMHCWQLCCMHVLCKWWRILWYHGKIPHAGTANTHWLTWNPAHGLEWLISITWAEPGSFLQHGISILLEKAKIF